MVLKTKTAMIAALVGLLAGCASSQSQREERAWNPAEDRALTQPRGALAQNPPNPYPEGSKRFIDLDASSTPAEPCAGRSFRLRDLGVTSIGLSYRDMDGAATLLSTMGYALIDENAERFDRYPCELLPIIVRPGVPADELITHDQGIIARPETVTGDLIVRPLRPANAVDMDHLLVFYHPEQESDVTRLEEVVRTVVDVPSPQVYIETLVLEVNEEDSKELGVSYENANIGSASLLNLGALEVGDGDTVGFTRNTRTEDGVSVFAPGTGIEIQIRALVDEGRAEILSRPSVLALSNRQAVIQIVDVLQTPILESTITQSGEVVISAYEFEPLLLGITLNLRPRVSDDRAWISLEIDATVEAEVDENSGTAFAPDPDGGRVALAEKKGSASRKVRTFARIPDRTPIVIGGLVAGNTEKQTSRVPVLGSIPFVGALFGATDNEVQKREVIIVLTPHILAEDAIGVASNRARDDVMDRVADLMLFNNSYRVRSEDVFNMNFLMQDPQFRAYRERALNLMAGEAPIPRGHPATRFRDGGIPGEEALVAKMLFDIVSRPGNRVAPNLDQVFLDERSTGNTVAPVSLGAAVEAADVARDDRALWLAFRQGANADAVLQAGVERRPGETWEDTQARLSSTLGPGQSGLLIRDAADLERLRRAIVVDTVLRLNGGYDALNVQTLREGKVLRLGSAGDYRNYRVGEAAATLSDLSVRYFAVLQEELARTYAAMDAAEATPGAF